LHPTLPSFNIEMIWYNANIKGISGYSAHLQRNLTELTFNAQQQDGWQEYCYFCAGL